MIEPTDNVTHVMFSDASLNTYWFKRYSGTVSICQGQNEIDIEDVDLAEFIKALKQAFAKE